jgi:hypothetical protein
VSIIPAGSVTVRVGGTQTFLAAVTGTANMAVAWTVEPGGAGGTIDFMTGVYEAPATVGSGVDHVIATSVADPTKSAQVAVTVDVSQAPLISPTAVTVGVGGHVQFSLSAPPTGDGWGVDGTPGGDPATVGIIDMASGLYTAPIQMPTSTTAVTSAAVTHPDAANSASVTWVSRFLTPESLPVDACATPCSNIPNAVVARDFNGDGLSDLATANTGTGTVSLLLSADESHFAAPVRLQVGSPNSGDPRALAVADINEDSTVQNQRLDLVIADADASAVAVRARLGLGDGTFGSEQPSPLPSNSDPLSIAVGHFDSDGHLDVAVANFLTDRVDVLQGAGDGTFAPYNTPIALTAGVAGPLGIAAADFNVDGVDDLAVANSQNDTVSVFLSDGNVAFAAAQAVPLDAGSGPSAVAAVTLDGNPYPDLVVTTAFDDGLIVILNTADFDPEADPRFGAPEPVIATGDYPVAVAAGDFNQDGVPDVVVANQTDHTVSTYLFDPGGPDTLVPSETYAVGQLPQALAVGDFNGDGWDDVAVANSNDDTVSILRNRGGPAAP